MPRTILDRGKEIRRFIFQYLRRAPFFIKRSLCMQVMKLASKYRAEQSAKMQSDGWKKIEVLDGRKMALFI